MNKIRFATIGTNFIVDSFIKGAVLDSRFEYAAVYSRTRQRGEEFASKYGVSKVYTSLQDLAAASDIDAVYIASPNICHADQSIMMMRSGKHVLCEKPLAPTAAEVEKMIAVSSETGMALMEAMKTTLLPNFNAVREALSKIGTVRRYDASFCQYSSRMKAFVEGESVANVFNPLMKGGALRDLGVYCIAPMVHLFGVPWQGDYTYEKASACISARSTVASPGNIVPSVDNQIDIQGAMIVDYPGMQAVLSYSKAADGIAGCEIQGEDGLVKIKKLSIMIGPELIFREGAGDHQQRGGIYGNTIDISLNQKEFMYYEAHEFMNLIEEGKIESEENSHSRSLDVARIVDVALNCRQQS